MTIALLTLVLLLQIIILGLILRGAPKKQLHPVVVETLEQMVSKPAAYQEPAKQADAKPKERRMRGWTELKNKLESEE